MHYQLVGIDVVRPREEELVSSASSRERLKSAAESTDMSGMDGTPVDVSRATEVMDGTPGVVIDRAALLERLGGDVALMKEIAEAFITGAPELIDQMRQAIRAQDCDALHRSAHTYKGTISIFGARSAAELAAQLEHRASAGDLSDALVYLERLESHTACVCSRLAVLSE